MKAGKRIINSLNELSEGGSLTHEIRVTLKSGVQFKGRMTRKVGRLLVLAGARGKEISILCSEIAAWEKF